MKTINPKNNQILSQSLDHFSLKKMPIFQLNKSYFIQDLSQSKETYKHFFYVAKKKKAIAVQIQDSYLLAIFILYLDGLVEKVLILPATTTLDQVVSFSEKLKIENLFTDKELSNLDKITVHNLRQHSIYDSKKTSSSSDQNMSTNWIIPTSGTTGTPKLISHSTASLTRTLKILIVKLCS